MTRPFHFYCIVREVNTNPDITPVKTSMQFLEVDSDYSSGAWVDELGEYCLFSDVLQAQQLADLHNAKLRIIAVTLTDDAPVSLTMANEGRSQSYTVDTVEEALSMARELYRPGLCIPLGIRVANTMIYNTSDFPAILDEQETSNVQIPAYTP